MAAGKDTITVNGGSGSTATVLGGTGNDDITVTTYVLKPRPSPVVTATTRSIFDVATDAGTDTLVFGNITYNGLQVENLNTQGTDTISGFNWEPAGPTAGAEDILNFSAFNGGITAVVFAGAMAGGW